MQDDTGGKNENIFTLVSMINESCITPAFCRLIFSRPGRNSRFIQIIDRSNFISSFSEYCYHSDEEITPPDNWTGKHFKIGDHAVFSIEIKVSLFLIGTIFDIYQDTINSTVYRYIITKSPLFFSEIAHMNGDRNTEALCLRYALDSEENIADHEKNSIFEIFIHRDIETYVDDFQIDVSVEKVNTESKTVDLFINGIKNNSRNNDLKNLFSFLSKDPIWNRFVFLVNGFNLNERKIFSDKKYDKNHNFSYSVSKNRQINRITGSFVRHSRKYLGISPEEMAEILGMSIGKLQKIEGDGKSSLNIKTINRIERYFLDHSINSEEIYRNYKSENSISEDIYLSLESGIKKKGRGKALEETAIRIGEWKAIGKIKRIDLVKKWFKDNSFVIYVGIVKESVWSNLAFNPDMDWSGVGFKIIEKVINGVIVDIPRTVTMINSNFAGEFKHIDTNKLKGHKFSKIFTQKDGNSIIVIGYIGQHQDSEIKTASRKIRWW